MNLKNIFGVIALITVNSQTALITKPQNKTNVYVETIGTSTSEIATINYPLQTYNNLTNIKARARVRQFTNQIYYEVLVETNKINDNPTFEITDQTAVFTINPPLIDYITNAYTKFAYIDELDQSQYEFLNGQNYTDYYDLLNYVYMDENTTLVQEETLTTIDPNDDRNKSYQYQYKNYLYFEFNLTYSGLPEELRNNLRNNLNIISEINLKQNYRIVLPDNTYEVIDLAGLMFTILGMPFAWISTAFNFTIFAGTPYAVNIGEILLSLIAVMIGLIIIRIVIKQ